MGVDAQGPRVGGNQRENSNCLVVTKGGTGGCEDRVTIETQKRGHSMSMKCVKGSTN